MDYDFSQLEDFQPQVTETWNNWQFNHEQYADIPISFFSRFDRMGKCCDIANIANRQEDVEFIQVHENIKQKSKNFIWKDNTWNDRRKMGHYNLRVLTKKAKKNYRPWVNQIKTKFKEITVKNDWTLLKNINKNFLENLESIKPKITELHTKGNLRYLNPKVERNSWKKMDFVYKNQDYKIQQSTTLKDGFLKNKAIQLMSSQDEKVKKRKHVVCSLQFLLAIMTVRGGQFPWTLTVDKMENILTMQNYNEMGQSQNCTYLDMFTENENTNNNMPRDQARVKENCATATKLTSVFRDLLASGQQVDKEDLQQAFEVVEQKKDKVSNQKEMPEQGDEKEEQQQQQIREKGEGQDDEEDEDVIKLDEDRYHKYLKINLGDTDVYTRVTIDGMKKKHDGQLTPVLIRTFVETESDGAWLKDLGTSTGKIVSQEWQGNACSVQKWICEAKLAGVDTIKTGFMGVSKGKPTILNCDDNAVSSLESFLSFKMNDCWTVLKRILNLIFASEDGTYVLSRAPYTPLSMKLYKKPDENQEESDDEDN